MSYKKLEIWQLSRIVVIEIHHIFILLPKFEQYEEAQQIRRSSKTVKVVSWKDMEEENTKQILYGF